MLGHGTQGNLPISLPGTALCSLSDQFDLHKQLPAETLRGSQIIRVELNPNEGTSSLPAFLEEVFR